MLNVCIILEMWQIYQSCEESYRLTENGNLDVPSEKTDAFCEGPCMSETNLVLGCIDNIFSHFIFYNRATLEDVKETILAGCGYGPERGDYHVLIAYYNLRTNHKD